MSERIYIELRGLLYNAVIETFGTVTSEELNLIESYVISGQTVQVDISTAKYEEMKFEIVKLERDNKKIDILIEFFGERHNTGIDLIDLILRNINGEKLFSRLEKLMSCSNEKISRQADRLDEQLSMYFNGYVDFEGYMDYQCLNKEITKLEKLQSLTEEDSDISNVIKVNEN